MSIIADRGLFVRLLVQSGKFGSADAEAFADAMDAATREPATKDDVAALRAEMGVMRAELKAEIAALRAETKQDIAALRAEVVVLGQRMDAMEKRLDARIDALGDRIMVRLGGLMIAMTGILFAALRLSLP
jgi:predicted dinucleotide-binding enzyme